MQYLYSLAAKLPTAIQENQDSTSQHSSSISEKVKKVLETQDYFNIYILFFSKN